MILSGSECTLKSRFSWRSFSVTELQVSREKRLAINTTPRVNRLDCGELADNPLSLIDPQRGIVKTCGLACYDEVARSVAGRGRSCRSDQEPSLTIRSVVGTQPVTNGDRDCLGMRHTTTALRLGILGSRSQQ
jgi:hypothetical protein